jgi:hypothetical protein
MLWDYDFSLKCLCKMSRRRSVRACQASKLRLFALDSIRKHSNSFCTNRSTTLSMHVADMIVMESPVNFAGAQSCLSHSIRITAKTMTKTV